MIGVFRIGRRVYFSPHRGGVSCVLKTPTTALALIVALPAMGLEVSTAGRPDLWTLTDAPRFRDVELGQVAVAKREDFCGAGSSVLSNGNAPAALDLGRENILVRSTELGFEVWIALAPEVATTFEAKNEYVSFLSEMSARECQVDEEVTRIVGVGVLGLSFFDAEGGVVEMEYSPPRWRCGSFMAPNCIGTQLVNRK